MASDDENDSKKGSADQDTLKKKKSKESVDERKKSKESLDERKKSKESVNERKKSKESLDGGKNKGKGDKDKAKGKDKGKDKGLAEKRGSLKFGEEDDKKGHEDKKKDKKGKKPEEEPEKAEFDASKYKKPTVVQYHDNNDLMLGKGVGYKPDDAVPKKGPGVTSEIEKIYGPCTLLSEFKYTTWADTVVPLKNHNVVQGFHEMALCLIKLAANGGENMSHEDAFLAVSFLSNVRNDLGEYPPNILSLMEHIDYLTKNDGTAGSDDPKFKQMDACKIKEWY